MLFYVPRLLLLLPQVSNTAEIGGFKVLGESGIASGVRRIEAVAGPAVMEYLSGVDGVLRELSGRLKVKAEELPARVEGLLEDLKAAQKVAAELAGQLAVAKAAALAAGAAAGPSGARFVVGELAGVDAKSLQEAAQSLQAQLGDPAAVVLGSASADGKASFVVAFSPGVVTRGLKAGQFVGGIAKICGGGGGGRPNLAQAGGKDGSRLGEALAAARQQLEAAL